MIRSIEIKPVLNGFVASVGCQQLVFTSVQDLSAAVRDYYLDPEGVEKKHIEGALNKSLLAPGQPQIGTLQLGGATTGSGIQFATGQSAILRNNP